MKLTATFFVTLIMTRAALPLDAQTAAGVEDLLRLHHEARVAHVLDDAALLLRSSAPGAISVSGGSMSVQRRAQAEQNFGEYFRATEFLEWEDIAPPRIQFSPDSQWASVIVQKRLRLIETLESGVTHEAVNYAWTALWRRSPDWKMFLITSTDRTLRADSIPIRERTRAREILAAARKFAGGDTAVARIGSLQFNASARSARTAYTVTVRSARDGRAYMKHAFPARAAQEMGVDLEGGWSRTGTTRDSLSRAQRTILHGHEAHLLALAPEARFHNPRARARVVFHAAEADVVEFQDPLGEPASFFYDPATGRPRGYRVRDHGSDTARSVDAVLGDWRRIGQVLLPHLVEFRAAGEVYRYTILDASVDWLPLAAFSP